LGGGFLLGHYAPDAAGSGIPQLKAADWRDMGKIPLRVVVVKFLAGVLSVGGGLSLGREGATVQLAGGITSALGGKIGLINFRRRTITACGAAAGLAAALNAPIAAVTFVLEEIIEDLNSRSIGPILLASFSAVFCLYLIQGDKPAFIIPAIKEFHARTYMAVISVGYGEGFVQGVVSRAQLNNYSLNGNPPSPQEAVCVAPEEYIKTVERILIEAPLNIVLLVSPQKTLHDLLRSQMRKGEAEQSGGKSPE
jgi:H+/Cl- antiporter ClcA